MPRLVKRKKSYGTFVGYCRERWGFYRDRADRLINAAKTINNLAPIGVKPTSESQVRPLTHLPPEEQKEVWKKAMEKAPKGRVTARHRVELLLNSCHYYPHRNICHLAPIVKSSP